MDIIKSKENRYFKEIIKLDTKKHRDKVGLFKIEGINLVREAEAGGMELVMLAVDAENISMEISEVLENIISKGNNIEILYFSEQLFRRLSDTINPQGICAVAKQKNISAREFFEKKENGNVVVLDNVQDPGNVGNIIRTAEAAGYVGVLSTAGSADIYSSKVVRACAGTIFRLPILSVRQMSDAVRLLKENDKKIVCLDMAGDTAYFETRLKENIALVLGNEGNGISDESRAAADLIVKIPMTSQIESLNVAVSAAIVMYENMRT